MYDLVAKNAPKIKRFAADKTIQWYFIPPHVLHFGGIWEASVKSLKIHLFKTIERYTLMIDQFVTVLNHIDACLNSRLLMTESSDPNDLNVNQ